MLSGMKVNCPGGDGAFEVDDLFKHAMEAHPNMALGELARVFDTERAAEELEAHAKALRAQADAAEAEAKRLRGG